ncbi:MAG: Gfo/Idh/MocA family oxidoreductase [Armatimonadetes bacterium]|nr:Gfo/Idh/MocA family oxidoreductase [Armatimonadota bacterium]
MKVGILGLAHGHVHSYCVQWRERPDLDISVVAGWDHNLARLEQTAKSFGFQPFESVPALLEAVEAVVVGAETSMHADLVEQAARARKPVVLQKPMALTMADADRIVRAVESGGIPFTMAWQMRTDPQNIEMKRLLDSGMFGKVFMVRRRHALGVHLWSDFAGMWHNNPACNRDIFADDASHPIDFLQWLLGVPETVMAEIETLYSPAIPSDNGAALFRYPGGPLAEVVCSFTCTAHENTTEIVCERGTIIQNYGDGPSAGVPRPEGACGLKWYTVEKGDWTCSEIPSPPTHSPRIAGLAEPLSDFLHGKRPSIATVQEGRMSLRMVLACYVSAREGRRVRIDEESVRGV